MQAGTTAQAETAWRMNAGADGQERRQTACGSDCSTCPKRFECPPSPLDVSTDGGGRA